MEADGLRDTEMQMLESESNIRDYPVSTPQDVDDGDDGEEDN